MKNLLISFLPKKAFLFFNALGFLFYFTINTVVAQSFPQMRVVEDGIILKSELIDKNITDANGEVCSGLIIKTDLKGLSYDSNNGIVKINHNPGKDLIFLSPNERILSIFKIDYLPLKIDLNSYGVYPESGTVWELTITDQIDESLIPVNFVVSPDDAILILNNERTEVSRTHYLKEGIFVLAIQKNGFKIIKDTINVTSTNNLFVYDLVPSVNLSASNTQILNGISGVVKTIDDAPIQEARITTTPFTKIVLSDEQRMFKIHNIPMGTYTIKVEKEMYHTTSQLVVVDKLGISNNIINFFEFEQNDNPDMILVKGGTFQMSILNNDKLSVKTVSINHFYISKNEVTFNEYIEFCDETGRQIPDNNGWGFGKRPVINVSWDDAVAYCTWAGGRLPTEAEWEYAARGGKSKGLMYSGSNNIDEVAWYSNNSRNKTHEVGTKLPNELGIYDMSGNVWEWCEDFDTNSQSNAHSNRIIRGGSFNDRAHILDLSNSPSWGQTNKGFQLGFRIVENFKK